MLEGVAACVPRGRQGRITSKYQHYVQPLELPTFEFLVSDPRIFVSGLGRKLTKYIHEKNGRRVLCAKRCRDGRRKAGRNQFPQTSLLGGLDILMTAVTFSAGNLISLASRYGGPLRIDRKPPPLPLSEASQPQSASRLSYFHRQQFPSTGGPSKKKKRPQSSTYNTGLGRWTNVSKFASCSSLGSLPCGPCVDCLPTHGESLAPKGSFSFR